MKIDNYRIYRLLEAIRKGLYWNNVNFIDNYKKEQLFLQYNTELKELDGLSNLVITIAIFLATLFVSIMQLLQAFSNDFFDNYWMILSTSFLFLIILTFIYYFIKKHFINKRISTINKNILDIIEKETNDIRETEFENIFQSSLIELELLDEIGLEYAQKFRSETVSQKEYEELVKKISDRIDSIKSKLNDNIDSLRQKKN